MLTSRAKIELKKLAKDPQYAENGEYIIRAMNYWESVKPDIGKYGIELFTNKPDGNFACLVGAICANGNVSLFKYDNFDSLSYGFENDGREIWNDGNENNYELGYKIRRIVFGNYCLAKTIADLNLKIELENVLKFASANEFENFIEYIYNNNLEFMNHKVRHGKYKFHFKNQSFIFTFNSWFKLRLLDFLHFVVEQLEDFITKNEINISNIEFKKFKRINDFEYEIVCKSRGATKRKH